jgi:hypothetical protein
VCRLALFAELLPVGILLREIAINLGSVVQVERERPMHLL